MDEDSHFQIMPFQPEIDFSDAVGNKLFNCGKFDSSPLKPSQLARQFTQLQDENKNKKMSFVKKSSLTKKKSITVINHNVTSNLSSVNNITSDSLMPQKGNYSEMCVRLFFFFTKSEIASKTIILYRLTMFFTAIAIYAYGIFLFHCETCEIFAKRNFFSK